jgi:hypothetical protein
VTAQHTPLPARQRVGVNKIFVAGPEQPVERVARSGCWWGRTGLIRRIAARRNTGFLRGGDAGRCGETFRGLIRDFSDSLGRRRRSDGGRWGIR